MEIQHWSFISYEENEKPKKFRLILYHKHIIEMIKQFNEINFNHLPWERNQMADALATLATMS